MAILRHLEINIDIYVKRVMKKIRAEIATPHAPRAGIEKVPLKYGANPLEDRGHKNGSNVVINQSLEALCANTS